MAQTKTNSLVSGILEVIPVSAEASWGQGELVPEFDDGAASQISSLIRVLAHDDCRLDGPGMQSGLFRKRFCRLALASA
jgi:hypothetical protein